MMLQKDHVSDKKDRYIDRQIYRKCSVFDIVLNGDLTVASDLDIFERVGRGVAHDEVVQFTIQDNKIMYQVTKMDIYVHRYIDR